MSNPADGQWYTTPLYSPDFPFIFFQCGILLGVEAYFILPPTVDVS